MVYDMLHMLSSHLNIQHLHISPHTLRRSGATCAADFGATPLQITKHGLWKSEVYMTYLLTSPNMLPPVDEAFKKAFNGLS